MTEAPKGCCVSHTCPGQVCVFLTYSGGRQRRPHMGRLTATVPPGTAPGPLSSLLLRCRMGPHWGCRQGRQLLGQPDTGHICVGATWPTRQSPCAARVGVWTRWCPRDLFMFLPSERSDQCGLAVFRQHLSHRCRAESCKDDAGAQGVGAGSSGKKSGSSGLNSDGASVPG